MVLTPTTPRIPDISKEIDMIPRSDKLNWKLAATVGTITGVAVGGFVLATPDTNTTTPDGVLLEDIANSVPRLSAPVVVTTTTTSSTSSTSSEARHVDPTPFTADFDSPFSARSALSVASAASPASPDSPNSPASPDSPPSPLSPPSPVSAPSVDSPASPASPASPSSPGSGASS